MAGKDGVAKNWEVVLFELRHWWYVMRHEHIPRFKAVTWRSGRNNVFHLLMNLLVETIRALPRTLAYSAVILAVVAVVV